MIPAVIERCVGIDVGKSFLLCVSPRAQRMKLAMKKSVDSARFAPN